MIIVGLGDSSMGINFSKYSELPKIKSFRITIPGLDTKELVESLTSCLGKLGNLPRKMGPPCEKQFLSSKGARTNEIILSITQHYRHQRWLIFVFQPQLAAITWKQVTRVHEASFYGHA